jgi:hypothetical protein
MKKSAKLIHLTRRRRKAGVIALRNSIRLNPTRYYEGGFYCDHDPDEKWQWVAVSFYHPAARLVIQAYIETAEYVARTLNEEIVEGIINKTHPVPPFDLRWLGLGTDGVVTDSRASEFMAAMDARNAAAQEALEIIDSEPQTVEQTIGIDGVSGNVVLANVVLDGEEITLEIVRHAVDALRKLRVPIPVGFTMHGEPVSFIFDHVPDADSDEPELAN